MLIGLCLMLVVYAGTLTSIPVERTTFTPRTNIQAEYARFSQENGLLRAKMSFKTHRPTIRLINFPQIQSIECHQDVLLTFTSNETAAYNAWQQTTDLAFLIPYEAQCFGKEAAFVSVLSLTQMGPVLAAQVDLLNRDDVFDEWELGVDRFNPPDLSKRELYRYQPHFIKRELHREHTWNFDSNAGNAPGVFKPVLFWDMHNIRLV